MTRQEGGQQTPLEAASQVYTTFALLVQGSHPLLRQRTTISHPDTECQQKLAAIRPLIIVSEASPYYKQKIDSEMFGADGRYKGGPYMDAPAMYFGIYLADDSGIFDKESAAGFEAQQMLFEARTLMMQSELDPKVFTGAMDAAKEGRAALQEWATSYDQHYDESLVAFFEGVLEYVSPEARERLREDINRLNALLTRYTQEEK